nr:ribonuclease H-like domain-containing protein [Tanacetum cinerariifolium]
MSVKTPTYVNLESLSDEHQKEKTPSPPPRNKYLSPPHAPSKLTSSRSTHYTASSPNLKQIDPDDLKEIDLKWQMTMLTMSARRECRSPNDNRNKETTRRTVLAGVSTLNVLVSQCDAVGGYDWSFQADEEPTNYALMTYASLDSSSFLGSDNKVIEFRDSYEVPANAATTGTASDGTGKKKGRTVTVTADDMQKRKNDVKAITILLMSFLDEHQLRFSKYKTAQELWAAILKTFGGNETTKKTKKNFLKQQYGNFKAKGSETLEQTFNRLQIDEEDMEEMDIKWNIALLSMRADGFWKKTGEKISIQGTDVAGFDKSKVECFNCHKMGHFARECRAPRSQDRRRRDNYIQGENHALVADEEAPTEFALMAKTSAESKVFDNSLGSKDCKKNTDSLNTEHKDRELKYYEKIRGLEFKTESSADCIESLKKELELIKKEKEGLDSKLTGFQTASKDLDSLLESQILDKNKEGLGYSAVPPPPTQIYSPPKKDMSWTGLPEFKDDTVTDYSRPSPAIESTSDDSQNKNTSEASPSTISPKPFIKFVKANDSPTKSKTDKAEKAKKSHARVKKGTSRSQNNTHKSFTPRPAVHKPHRTPMRPMRSNMNAAWPNITSFNKPAHSYTKKPFQRTSAVRSQYRGPRVPPVSRKFSTANRKFPTANRKFPTGGTKSSTADMG